MTTSYFVLSKNKSYNENTTDTNTHTIINFPSQPCFLLPRNLISDYLKNGLFEANLIEWCKQFCKMDGVFIDIGAHTGTYSLSLFSHVKHVYAFEPQKMTFYALCGGVALSNAQNITCMNIGLGSEEQIGTQTLHIVSEDGGGSTICSTNQNLLKTEDVEITILDYYNINDICFIKIDVEDNELCVLKGAVDTIKRNNYPRILFECNDPIKLSTIIPFLENLNYKITKIAGVTNMFLAYTD